MQGDFAGFNQTIENNNRNCLSQIDAIRFEVSKMAREHEADQLKIDRIMKLSETLDRNFNQHVVEMMEMFKMHDEDFHQKIFMLQ